ncbi:hypothetical protein OKW26_004060 [Paraburkholderia sp. 32]
MISEPRCRYITLVIGGNGETDAVVRECVATALIKASRTLLPPYASLGNSTRQLLCGTKYAVGRSGVSTIGCDVGDASIVTRRTPLGAR